MFESKSEAEKFLQKNRFSKTTKGLNISLFEDAVSEKDAKKALDMARLEEKKKILIVIKKLWDDSPEAKIFGREFYDLLEKELQERMS